MSQSQTMETLDQRRARHAWDLIERLSKKRKQEEHLQKFESQVKKFPVRVVSSGLGQALAFLESKKYAPDLLDGLGTWMTERVPGAACSNLLERVVKGDGDFLRRATDEVLAYMLWVVRFAEARGLTKEED